METGFDRCRNEATQLFIRTEGSVEEFKKYAATIDDEDYRDAALERFASLLFQQCRRDEAFEFLSQISNPQERAGAWVRMARTIRQANDPEVAYQILQRALAVAEEIPSAKWEHHDILTSVADEYRALGLEQEAVDMMKRAARLAAPVQDDFEARKTLRGAAVVLARWGHIPEASAIAAEISEPTMRSTAQDIISTWAAWHSSRRR